MRIWEIMQAPVTTVAPDTDALEAWEKMKVGGVRHLVVVDRKKVVGVVSDRDLGGVAGGQSRKGKRVSDLMTEGAVTTNPDATVRDAAHQFSGRGVGCLPVLDEDALVGIVTRYDMVRVLERGKDRPTVGDRRGLRRRGGSPKSTAPRASRTSRPE